jgi:hypothetical protein
MVEGAFFLRILAIRVCIVVVNRGGEVVVNCVVNVDSGTSLLWSLKIGHDFEVYLRRIASDGFFLGRSHGSVPKA